jgi:predicted short-subunit dehydrogenase-like oxidoreductase (DUF2520 family)
MIFVGIGPVPDACRAGARRVTTQAQLPCVSAIGHGALGQSLLRVWAERGCVEIGYLIGRTEERAQAAAESLGRGQALAQSQFPALARSSFIMLAVPDKELAAWVKRLATASPVERNSCLIFHCSGSFGSEILAPLVDQGFAVAAAHPIASFARDREFRSDAHPPLCCIEAQDDAFQRVAALFTAANFEIVRVAAIDRPLYHAAIVMAANFMAPLIDASLRAYQAAGIDEHVARRILKPILAEVLERALTQGPMEALSGPFVRGDDAVISGHIRSLNQCRPDDLRLYLALGQSTLKLAQLKGHLSNKQYLKIERILALAVSTEVAKQF